MLKKLTEQEIVFEELRKTGYVIFEDLLRPEEVDSLSEQLNHWFDKTPSCQGEFYGETTTRFGSLLRKAPLTQELVVRPEILSIADEFLLPYCDCYQLNLSQAVRIHPGAPEQPVHRDELMWPCAKESEFLINVIWAIDDFTFENGATRIWPAHKDQSQAFEYNKDDAIVAKMKKGSALVFLGSTRHCGGANICNEDRTGIIFSYSLGWLKQNENQFLAYPPDIASGFSKEIQDLIGYRIHKPNLGGYEYNCPSNLLGGEHPDVLPAVDAIPDHLLEVIEQLKQKMG
jgi:ectoine hydroxylase-related dioxygenase (phytanoyl-CoA dioxygenase family)|tara:strand:+ start:139447 stop:140307 length:861 start_codon:yes stop_codon:yes gene_type:complete